jgi:redox-sensitive bicupin YhaK (pirin superfamily)
MATSVAGTQRRIVHRTRGHRHGSITRLMSPSDLGQVVKPFVFLDLFEADGGLADMPIHPHSGIGTVTVFTKGEVRFDDPEAGQGIISYGGVEWSRAGGGMWHGKELSAASSSRFQGFQLWVALPQEEENGPSESQYLEASATKQAGPARVIVGEYGGVASPLRAPAGINYLLVTLKPGETWTYHPPQGQSIGWLAVAQGTVDAEGQIPAGEMAVFESSEAPIQLTAVGDGDAVFVLGSAVPHPNELHLGYYSVHTSAEALARGERRIAELGANVAAAGDRRTQSGSTPVFR